MTSYVLTNERQAYVTDTMLFQVLRSFNYNGDIKSPIWKPENFHLNVEGNTIMTLVTRLKVI